MKGFVYLIEIAIAAIIMTVILSVFFSIRIKQDWGSADIATIGSNVMDSIRNDNTAFVNILAGNYSSIDSSRPKNVQYGLKIIGSPKSNISIGTDNYAYLTSLLTQSLQSNSITFVNGRWINFTISQLVMNTPYDAIILVNNTSYSDPTFSSYLNNYLSSGGVVIGINDTLDSSNTNFKNFFNLSSVAGSTQNLYFTFYNTSQDSIAKYFLGIGMSVSSEWDIWNDASGIGRWGVTYYGGNKINLTNMSNNNIFRDNLVEGSTFTINGPDKKAYNFKVKKLFYTSQQAIIQPLNTSFVFKDFSEDNVVGNGIVGTATYSALTTNNSAVWMSSFPQSSEYASLLEAAVLSRLDNWTARYEITGRDKTAVSSFVSLCCDMPETSELYLTMWYEV